MERINDYHLFTIWPQPAEANRFPRPGLELDALRLSMFEGSQHLRSVECSWPQRKLSVVNKGVQRITFVMPDNSRFNEYVP